MPPKTPRVTLDLIYHELQTISARLTEHALTDAANFQAIQHSLEGTEVAPGLKMKVDRLEQSALSRASHFAYIWSAISALAVAFVSRWLWPGSPPQ